MYDLYANLSNFFFFNFHCSVYFVHGKYCREVCILFVTLRMVKFFLRNFYWNCSIYFIWMVFLRWGFVWMLQLSKPQSNISCYNNALFNTSWRGNPTPLTKAKNNWADVRSKTGERKNTMHQLRMIEIFAKVSISKTNEWANFGLFV